MSSYLYYIMYISFELSKGSHLNFKQFLEHNDELSAVDLELFGDYSSYYLHDKKMAKQFYQKAIKKEPNEEFMYHFYALSSLYFGDCNVGIDTLRNCKLDTCKYHF